MLSVDSLSFVAEFTQCEFFVGNGAAHRASWHAAMCDGSVHSMDYAMLPAVHELYSRRADGKPLSQ